MNRQASFVFSNLADEFDGSLTPCYKYAQTPRQSEVSVQAGVFKPSAGRVIGIFQGTASQPPKNSP